MICEYVEMLFNPVERMMIVRPCDQSHPNAIPWAPKSIGASSLVRVLYDSMGWQEDYTYRVPCQTIREPGGNSVVLCFDLDNYIGRAINKKDEVIMARKEAELAEEQNEKAKSYYYPPEEEDEPLEIRDMEERFQSIREQNRKIFGEPVFQHSADMRCFSGHDDCGQNVGGQDMKGKWDMLIEARPLDVDHRVDLDTVESLFQEIVEDPPKLKKRVFPGEVIDVTGSLTVENNHDESETEGAVKE